MRQISEDGRRILSDAAQRHGVSLDAVEHLILALAASGGSQAQFNHPDLGGMGQWSQGGMIMIGDMFNNGLKAKVDWLCQDLAGLLRGQDVFAPAPVYQSQQQGAGVSLFVPGSYGQASGWPEELGQPSSVGSQNNLRYAFFPATRRLAIDMGGALTIYDTGDHQIGGFSQQQGGDQSLTFTSQYGLVRVSDLPVMRLASPISEPVSTPDVRQEHHQPIEPATETPMIQAAVAPVLTTPAPAAPASVEDDIFSKIERLAALHAKGILTDEEFSTKKSELLARL
jgi:Short C-terminal domain